MQDIFCLMSFATKAFNEKVLVRLELMSKRVK
jgi:hypothetical protein